ncbi:hypothetical protein HanRHA438_Chr10g0445341 [Helianthus annuus]|nr:hypothetical protein HanRHA438_Chr10g0445341 [Helianthus annuus]
MFKPFLTCLDNKMTCGQVVLPVPKDENFALILPLYLLMKHQFLR